MVIKDIPTIASEDDLVAALKQKGRCLLFDIVGVEYADGEIGDEERYCVMEMHGRKETHIADVEFAVGEKWSKQRGDSNGPYCGAWHLPEFAGFREWVDCDENFGAGDVVNWREGVWDRSGAKPKCLGYLENMGLVCRESDDRKWVWIKLEDSFVVSDEVKDGRVHPLKAEIEIKRARKTVSSGGRRELRKGETGENKYLG